MNQPWVILVPEHVSLDEEAMEILEELAGFLPGEPCGVVVVPQEVFDNAIANKTDQRLDERIAEWTAQSNNDED